MYEYLLIRVNEYEGKIKLAKEASLQTNQLSAFIEVIL